jgi:hypothetical protein
MPRNKDLKRLVRARMKKTGEAYTAARAQITKTETKRAYATAASTIAATPAAAKDYAQVAGMSDAVIKEKTGCTWDRWVFALDHHHAAELSHGEIATLVKKKYKVGDWWAQMVTVGYERIKGLRARGQRLDGTYEASKSRTYNVPVKTLFESWADAGTRNSWLKEANVKVRTANAPKTMRLGWNDGTIVAVGFTAKGKSKSSVALAHTKLPSSETAKNLKQFWSERLDALGEVLASQVSS